MSGTPNIDLIPFSRRSGLRTCAWSTSSRITGRFSAAIRPAKPPPTGTRTPCSTSSSMPSAARVDLEDLSSPLEQRSEELVQAQVRKGGIGDRLQPADVLGRGTVQPHGD